MEKRSRRGISPRVLRVTFRSDDTLIGYMRGYFNVPDVFGSGGSGRTHQTALYQGADGADVITAAVREAGGRMAFTSVLGFRRYAVDQDRHRLHRRTRPRQARGHPGPGVHQADPAQALHHPGGGVAPGGLEGRRDGGSLLTFDHHQWTIDGSPRWKPPVITPARRLRTRPA
jgi:hypothetical protein